MRTVIGLLVAVSIPVFTAAQGYEKDVKTLDSTIKAIYETISGPAGEKRDWERFRSLHVEDAKLMAVSGQQSPRQRVVMSVEDYIERSGPFLEQRGFFETEIARRVEQYGHIAHVFSTYESRNTLDGEPFDRGINSIQLMHDGERWWVVSILWNGESVAGPIPEKYLKSGDGGG